MACLKMALTARDGHAPSLFALLRGCLDYGGYIVEPDGRVTGLLYRQFADFTRDRYQLRADIVTDLDPDRIIRELDEGRLVMASVHKEIRRPDHDPPATGGHLVLITGHDEPGQFPQPVRPHPASRHRHLADEHLRPLRGPPRNRAPPLGLV